ncbi:NUDIX domain-containing protein [Rickettsiella massiliensis]|uniref:NUDIX domain-containing protein n=1 Tax=Rickettsiella massiliensis TaxID=676517 RepID=UPI00029B4446|nr:NUDIX domain-containing protein [Rickettsiella massiliensis]
MVQPLFSATDVKMLECKLVYQGYFQMQRIKLQHRLFAGGWSQPLFREVFVRGEAVGVLLFDPKQDQLVLIEQLRAGIVNQSSQPWLVEIVAGMTEPGEDKQTVAQRETREETGLLLQNIYPITQYWLSPGGSNEWMIAWFTQ